jgi:hypothetical protein
MDAASQPTVIIGIGIDIAIKLASARQSSLNAQANYGRFSVLEARSSAAMASFSHMYAPRFVVP